MRKIFLLLSSIALLCCTSNNKSADTLVQTGTMPDSESGYNIGVSACYAATYNGTMLLTGGCNFPEKPAAEGGAKRYYKGIYTASTEDITKWRMIGELPEPSAYGVPLKYGESLIIVGGINSDGANKNVYMLTPEGDNCGIKQLPPIPCTIDNAAGAISGNRIYIVGGNADGKASTRFFTLDIAAPSHGWMELENFPGRGRVQPVCAATIKALYLWGGFSPCDSTSEAAVHCDGAKYDFATQKWSTLPMVTDENGEPLTLSGGTATTIDDKKIIAAGGVDREIFRDAISGKYNLIAKEKYMHQPAEWYKFNDRMLAFDTEKEEWRVIIKNKTFARAGATLTTDAEYIYYVGGELKPGIRTTEISKLREGL